MNNLIQFFDLDSYKVSQHKQYPVGTRHAMSYIEARKGDYTLFFGLQYILKQLQVPTQEEVDAAAAMSKAHFGRDDIFNYEGWSRIAEMRYFPLMIKAVPEGTVVPTKNVLATVESTHDDFVWLVSWFETQLLRVWYPITVATESYKIKQTISKYLEETGTPESIGFKLHDFGSRGASSSETAMIGGMAHLVNFLGTDTLGAYMGALEYYNADSTSLGFSIPASEHSTITSWGKDWEIDAYRNMIEQFGKPGALYACVSDSYNIWKALDMWKDLEPLILEKGGTLVIRPDSGDPVNTPVDVVRYLIMNFDCDINDKGYVVLPDHIRVIQGDGIDHDSIKAILEKLKGYGISADNIAFGMGGALLQKHNRDDYGFAMKMSGIVVGDEERDVFKDPITDRGKVSKKGFLTLTTDFETVREEDLEDRAELLELVFCDGYTRDYSFDQVRNNAK